MKIQLIETNENGIKWFDVDGVVYGLDQDQRLLDDCGAPYPADSEADILGELCKH